MHRLVRCALESAGVVALSFSVHATTVTIGASKDNTIYSDQPDASNGIGNGIFIGETADSSGSEWRRGLISFNVAANVPAGATINSASLTLFAAKGRQITATNIDLFKATTNWGEGTSDAINNPLPGSGSGGGGGAAATNGDATWNDAVYNALASSVTPWTNPGGDFVGAPSSTATITVTGVTYTWTSTAKMIADVQSWLNAPSSNFGWVLRGNEASIGSARRFDSRESPTASHQPALVISYTEAPEPASLALLGAAALGLTARRRKI